MMRYSEKRHFSIRTLLLCMLIPALLGALLSPVFSSLLAGRLILDDIARVTLAGLVCGKLIGFFVGLSHHRRRIGAAWGVVLGAIIGSAAAPLVLVDFNQIVHVLIGSSALIMVLVAAGAYLTRQYHYASLRRLDEPLDSTERPD